jgi:hypothetical protein
VTSRSGSICSSSKVFILYSSSLSSLSNWHCEPFSGEHFYFFIILFIDNKCEKLLSPNIYTYFILSHLLIHLIYPAIV